MSDGSLNYASATDALAWMHDLRSANDGMLFRGQRRAYPSILPTLMRDTVGEEERIAWWNVLRWFVSARNGIAGYSVPGEHHAHAIVQHYLEHSTLIDLTGSPEVAMYFALAGADGPEPRVVYAVGSRELSKSGLVVTDHDFIAMPPGSGGEKHRWLRQDGFTVGPTDLAALPHPGDLDLVRVPGLMSLEFKAVAGEEALREKMGDLESTEDDPLASKVRSIFESIARSRGLFDQISRLIPRETTVDAHATLVANISRLLDLARRQKSPLVKEIEHLLDGAAQGAWDTGFDASLAYFRRQIEVEKPPEH